MGRGVTANETCVAVHVACHVTLSQRCAVHITSHTHSAVQPHVSYCRTCSMEPGPRYKDVQFTQVCYPATSNPEDAQKRSYRRSAPQRLSAAANMFQAYCVMQANGAVGATSATSVCSNATNLILPSHDFTSIVEPAKDLEVQVHHVSSLRGWNNVRTISFTALERRRL